MNIEELTASIKGFLSKNKTIVETNTNQLNSNEPSSRIEINTNDDDSLIKSEEKSPEQKVSTKKTESNSIIGISNENKSIQSNEYFQNAENNNYNDKQNQDLSSPEEKSPSINHEVSFANPKSLSKSQELLPGKEFDISTKEVLNTEFKTNSDDDQQPLLTNSIAEELAPNDGSKVISSTSITVLPSSIEESRIVN